MPDQPCFICGPPAAASSIYGWSSHGEGHPIVAARTAMGEQPYCDRHLPREEGQEIDVSEFPA